MIIQSYSGDIEPSENTVFVFGSNPLGINGNPDKGTGGAALTAQLYFGVKQGEKMTNRLSDSGDAYGLVTVRYPGGKRTISLNEIKDNFKVLFDCCLRYPNKKFKLAYRNTDRVSLNGYSGNEMIRALANAIIEYGKIPENFYVSDEWKSGLNKIL